MKKKTVWMAAVMAAALSMQACGSAPAVSGGAAGTDREQTQTEESGQTAAEEIESESAETQAESVTPENSAEEKPGVGSVEKNGVGIDFKEEKSTKADEDGSELVTVEALWPTVTIAENPEAAEKINKYFEGQKSALEERALEYADGNHMARIDGASSVVYSIYMGYGQGRIGESSISFTTAGEDFTGGAHPSHMLGGITFDSVSGEILTLNDIFTDKEMAVEFINEQILEQAEKMDQTIFFEGYQDSVKDILTEDTWWFSDEGFTVAANEYLIAPYVAGSFQFTIPYEDFTYLKEEYRR